ncbi:MULTISPECIES: hypothetical protein [unclassified Mucilaginibacter]|nr:MULTISPECIES: hypothetical protein [unclassified Mucilaginibacter]MEB0263623.1 hypothetical protein [Mucilaginibacter sp. 10I4]MEB0278622.1 hypothetical protein [Mucilaginibacter sp. 10B2]MEB0299332.1 hypothetical protein [Mucilaginibacter sp. 5C4]WPX23424.1 hypothetical protein RHM67_19295 [Mucilaginibacter sp. 5C4]
MTEFLKVIALSDFFTNNWFSCIVRAFPAGGLYAHTPTGIRREAGIRYNP